MTEDRRDAVSCDPALYADGGLYDQPGVTAAVMAEHARLRDRFETIEPLFDGFGYARPVDRTRILGPEPVADALAARLAALDGAFRRGAASSLVRIRGARLRDRSLSIVTPEGEYPLYETHRPGDRPYLQAWRPADAAEPLEGGPFVSLELSGAFNYGHWLVDDLARFGAVERVAAITGRPPCIVLTSQNDLVDPARAESLRAFGADGPDFTIRFLDPARSHDIPELYFPTPVSLHPTLKNPRALDDLASRAAQAVARSMADIPPGARRRTSPRIYVHRRPERGRAIENDAEILAIMRRRRFRIVDTECLSFLDQAGFFGAAKLVVGTMGAAMTNTVFSRPGTRVLYLAPETWTEPFYWDLAAARGHHYAVCLGPAEETEPHRARFRIDPAMLEQALDDLA